MNKALIAILFAMTATSPAFASSGVTAPSWVKGLIKAAARNATPEIFKHNLPYYTNMYNDFVRTESANLPAETKKQAELGQLKSAHKSVDRQAASIPGFDILIHRYFTGMQALVEKQDHVALKAKLDTIGGVLAAARNIYK